MRTNLPYEIPRLLQEMRSFPTGDVSSPLEIRIPCTHIRISKVRDMWHCCIQEVKFLTKAVSAIPVGLKCEIAAVTSINNTMKFPTRTLQHSFQFLFHENWTQTISIKARNGIWNIDDWAFRYFISICPFRLSTSDFRDQKESVTLVITWQLLCKFLSSFFYNSLWQSSF
jgi:hypothetical protein